MAYTIVWNTGDEDQCSSRFEVGELVNELGYALIWPDVVDGGKVVGRVVENTA